MLGVGDTVCQVVVLLGARKRHRGRREEGVGVRYPLLIPCALLQALADLNACKGKSVGASTTDPVPLHIGKPWVNLAT